VAGLLLHHRTHGRGIFALTLPHSAYGWNMADTELWTIEKIAALITVEKASRWLLYNALDAQAMRPVR
jgi:hypothetical protein